MTRDQLVNHAVSLLEGTSRGPWTCDEDGRIYASDGEGGEGGLVGWVHEHQNVRVVLRKGENFNRADGRLMAAAPTIVPELASQVVMDAITLETLLLLVQELEVLLTGLGRPDAVERLGVSDFIKQALSAE